MKKSIVVLSAIAALSTTSFAAKVTHADMMQQIEALKAQISALENQVGVAQSATKENKVSLEKMMQNDNATASDARFKKLEKKVERIDKTANIAKVQSAKDNIKWDVDFRTQVDNIEYKHASGKKSKNDALLTNRLWLGASYAPNDNTVFKAKLSYNKAWGDTANHSQSNNAMGVGYADFDWVTNENAMDNEVKVKEAYWLYKDDTIAGLDMPWTVSVGRRPSTDGLGINVRHNQEANSPLSHVVNVEFDGFSFKLDTENVTGIPGSWFKVCGGRGLTNAKPRFQMDGTDYAEDETKNTDIDMLGFIASLYNDGQYSAHLNYSRAWNLIGFDQNSINAFGAVSMGFTPASMGAYMQSGNPADLVGIQPHEKLGYQSAYAPSFKDVGDMDYATILLKSDGIGDGISDYLDDTIVFASAAMSKTKPNALGMLGSTDSKVGHSFWIGVNAPCPIDQDNARIGIEWNKGSKYWRSMTYGEDSFTGSKIAARGTAWEIYRNQKINNALSWGLSYSYIKYDYTGSNSFFGAEGTPMKMDEAQAMGMDPVEKAQNIKAFVRYTF